MSATVGNGLRVLHVFDHSLPHQTGYAFRSAAILREQAALGIETCQVTSSKQDTAVLEEEVDGLHFHRTLASTRAWARAPLMTQLDTVLGLGRRLEALLDVVRPQIVHAYSPCLTGLAALRPVRRRNLPLVYEMRSSWEDAAVTRGTAVAGGPRYRLSRAAETYLLRQADVITTICDGLRADIVERGIPAGRVTVVPNAVERVMFEPPDPERVTALRSEFGAADRTLIGYIGSFHPYEGLDLLFDALLALGDQRRRFRLLLAGGGSEEPRLRDRARALGLGEELRFLGRVPHERIRDYYAAMDMLVYPRERTRLTDKVTPLKPLEAMAQHRLVLASDIGGHRELVRDGETGILFPANDAAALAQQWLAAKDQARRREICRNAYRFVSEERTWQSCASRYLDVYRQALQGRATSERPRP